MIYVGTRTSSGDRAWLPLDSTWETVHTDTNGGAGGRLFIAGSLVKTYDTVAAAEVDALDVVSAVGCHVLDA